ncbi:centromere kinetochore component CENP-T histone fold domain-containing protein [Hirsutella rhossiliensis]
MASTPKTPGANTKAKHGRAAAAASPTAPATLTPSRRALSDEPPSSRPSLRTPLDRSASRNLLASIRRGTSASGGRRINNNAPTPHAKAARLALNQRRNALFTPGKNRRRSLMEQRETPMGVLRNLSRALATKSRPVATSSSPLDQPSSIAPIPEEEDDDDELSIDRPRLSLPLDQDDQDSDLQPPRSSGLEEENYTLQSIELPRRALSEQPGLRLSRGSFGDDRISDFFDQINNDPTLDAPRHSDFFPGFLEHLQADAGDLTLNRIDADPARRTTMGRDSDFGLQLPAGLDDQTTFLLSEPSAGPDPGSPVVDHSLAEAAAAEGADGLPDVSLAPDAGMADSDDDALDVSLVQDRTSEPAGPAPRARKRQKRISKHGVEYPPLPPSFVKKVAQTALNSSGLSNPRISADTLAALTQASDWFFEQLGDDLGAYAKHAKRKTVEESDVVTLMRRQRQVGSDATMFSLAQRHLSRELLQDLRMPVPQPTRKRRGKRPHSGDDDEHGTEVT